MPVSCSVSIAKLSTAELRELDYRVMRHAFDSQNELGRLADERIYQADLAARLRSAGMTVSREVEVQLLHCEFCKSLFLDLIVAEQAVYEMKVVKTITDAHIGQLLTYLHLLDTAFKVTAMNRDTSAYRSQLARLIQFSPLRAIHWINIARHEVTFTTIPGHR